jgi:YD repeat-containing protein
VANSNIGIKGWRNYSSFSLFGSGSQRADRNTSIFNDTFSGNLAAVATDWNLAARIPCSITRTYNHLDSTAGVDRPFGPGWYWQFDMNLIGSLDGTGTTTLKSADGSEYDFTSPTTVGAYKVYTSPAGMHDSLLRFHISSAYFELLVGTLAYRFDINNTDSRARLMWIRDAFTNGLELDRDLDGNSEPLDTFNFIQIRYHDGSGWVTQNIIEPTYTTYNGENRITMLRLLETINGGNYLDIDYTYSGSDIDGWRRLVTVEPKFAGIGLDLEVKYEYNTGSGLGLQMTKLYDTNGAKAGTPYYWEITYNSNKVASVIFPIDATPTTGTVAYAYAASAPASWSHASPNNWTMVTDAEGNDWYFGQDSSGRVEFAVDPLWANSSHESYSEYAYNADNQITSVKTPKPNAESGQLTTRFEYNSDKHLSAIVDAYGFVSWYVYGSRADYETSGTGATKQEVIGIFTPMPGVQAYRDNDHTDSETVAPTLTAPVDPTTYVSWDSGNGWWEYMDGSGTPKAIKLARTVNDYTFANGTGQLTELLSCSPENFDESSATTYDLTSASACSKQAYNATTGDLYQSYTPRQFMDSNLKYSQFAYDQVHGSLTRSANADGVANNPGTPDATEYSYDATGTLITMIAQPLDPADQWTEFGYTGQWFRSTVKKPDILSWGIDPIQSVNVYDYNGNLTQSWQAKPGATPADWDGDLTGGAPGYDKVTELTYDRLNRTESQTQNVALAGVPAANVSTFKYDKNSNLLRQRGPAYGSTPDYSYNFMEYDEANRMVKAYNTIASSNSNLGSVTGGTKFVLSTYDLVGNILKTYDQLYDWPNDPDDYHYTAFSYDWMSRQISMTGNYDDSGPTARTPKQVFDAAGLVRFSEDAMTFRLWPEYDRNGRQISLHRASSGGDGDLSEYDYNGNQEYYYTYQDAGTGVFFRWRYEYDRLDRRVNEGRERKVLFTWQDWNENTADTEFDLNGNLIKSYDKVNSGKFTERIYDDWLQLKLVKAPEVPNPAGGGNIIYETENTYDVLGRRIEVEDHLGNSTLFDYDELGRTVLVTDPLLNDTVTIYDKRGNRYQQLMSYGAVYSYIYDDQNRLDELRVGHDSTTDVTSYTYNELGLQIQIDYPDGGETQIEYDELNRRKEVRVLLSGSDFLETKYSYDLNNRVLVTTQPGNYTTTNTWDVLGNLTQFTDTNGDDTDYTYDLDNRRATQTRPNGLVTTWVYDWKTRQIANTVQEIDTNSANDITTSYSYDDNGQPLTITDGNGNAWTKTYDAMLRMVSLTMPNTNAHTITLDGNGNMLKTVDFKGTSHWYQYDELNRMKGHGANSSANDETYSWQCCNRMIAYTDAFGTADIAYDQLNRITSFEDSQGNVVTYDYDSMGRTTEIIPAQGGAFKTAYSYNMNGSLNTVAIYVAGTPETTSYTYNTTSGKLTQRNLPAASGSNIRTTYAYDGAGRLEYETVTRESGGGTTNLYRTSYAYTYIAAGSGGGRSLLRTEETYSGGWVNSNKVNYEWNALEWMKLEQRHDWVSSAWSAQYDVSQEYDKRGNRTRYHKNVQGSSADYGMNYDLSYTFNASSLLTAISDADDFTYNVAVTCDNNNNITLLDETVTIPGMPPRVNHIYTYFDVDDLNRVTAQRIKYFSGGAWQWKKRSHQYDAVGRLVKSAYKTWPDGGIEPPGNSLEHIYDQEGNHLQNYDGTSTFGSVWHWAGSGLTPETKAPLKSPNQDTAAQHGYNAADNVTAQRRTFLTPSTEGDQRHEWGQGRPQAKDSSGSGSNWANGMQSASSGIGVPTITSRLTFEGTVAATDMSRATDAREKGRIGILGSGVSFAGSYGRVTSEAIGRDVNPLGRGDGMALLMGSGKFGRINPSLPRRICILSQGNSVNNSMMQGGPDCSHCQGWPEGNSTAWGSSGLPCGTPGCQGELCNEGCVVGWTSGVTVTCCKDMGKPCQGPISAGEPEGSMTEKGVNVTDDPANQYGPDRCATLGYGWDCCNGGLDSCGNGLKGGFARGPGSVGNPLPGVTPSSPGGTIPPQRPAPGGGRGRPGIGGREPRPIPVPVLTHRGYLRALGVNITFMTTKSAMSVKPWDRSDWLELIAELLGAAIGQEMLTELGITAQDLACCLANLGIDVGSHSPQNQDVQAMIACFIKCKNEGPDDVFVFECSDCNDPNNARGYIGRGINEGMRGILSEKEVLDSIADCVKSFATKGM